ncbi:MAG: hypothetical protein K6F93_06290 [Lachnospiraceae bacterium]|nr:hypothetical protein [Lachnospiraceae bacterium]
MNNLKIVGTRGKKQKKAIKLLGFLGVAVFAVCLLIIFIPLGLGSGNAFAGENLGPPGTDFPGDPNPSETIPAVDNGSAELGSDPIIGRISTVDEDEREISFGPIGIGPNIQTGDYIDIRLMCADGTDYVVVSKKELLDYNAATGMSVLRVHESELLTLNSAMADRNTIAGVTLYAARYVDPLRQEAADISYRPNEAVSDQIRGRNDVIGR